MRVSLSILALGCSMLVHCGSSPVESTPTPAPSTDLLAPPEKGTGVQYKMVSHIASGQEIERCQLVLAPPEGLLIHKDEVRFTPGSHHVLLYQTAYTSIPTKDRRGEAVNAAEVHDCAGGPTSRWAVTGVLAGSQSRQGDSIVGELPEGVAIKVAPGTVLVMDTHYLNASSTPVDAEARVNLFTIPAAQMKTEAGVLFYYNPFIRIPASGVASAEMRCPVFQDISLVRVQSHMHRRGVGFSATLDDASGKVLRSIYENKEWEQVPVEQFEPLLQIKAGQSLDYRCDYKNPEARDVMQGQSTKDEMCMLIGPYFPRNAALENCADQTGLPAGTWTGTGTANGADTLACLAGAQSTDLDGGDALFGCVVDSCPGVAEQVSAVMRCELSDGNGMCHEACSTAGGDCGGCITTACGPAFGACQAALCK